MSYNKILDKDVKQIKNYLIDLVEETKSQYAKAFNMIKDNNMEAADEIIANDKKINDMQNDFTRMALWKIVKQKMVATDLRLAIGGIIISREIEKTADVAKYICKFVKKCNIVKLVKGKDSKIFEEYYSFIPKMFEHANTILNLIGSLIENFDESQMKEVDKLEKNMNDDIHTLIKAMTNSVPSFSDKSNIEIFVRFIRQLKNMEKASQSLFEIEETLQFIKTGSFSELVLDDDLEK